MKIRLNNWTERSHQTSPCFERSSLVIDVPWEPRSHGRLPSATLCAFCLPLQDFRWSSALKTYRFINSNQINHIIVGSWKLASNCMDSQVLLVALHVDLMLKQLCHWASSRQHDDFYGCDSASENLLAQRQSPRGQRDHNMPICSRISIFLHRNTTYSSHVINKVSFSRNANLLQSCTIWRARCTENIAAPCTRFLPMQKSFRCVPSSKAPSTWQIFGSGAVGTWAWFKLLESGGHKLLETLLPRTWPNTMLRLLHVLRFKMPCEAGRYGTDSAC